MNTTQLLTAPFLLKGLLLGLLLGLNGLAHTASIEYKGQVQGSGFNPPYVQGADGQIYYQQLAPDDRKKYNRIFSELPDTDGSLTTFELNDTEGLFLSQAAINHLVNSRGQIIYGNGANPEGTLNDHIQRQCPRIITHGNPDRGIPYEDRWGEIVIYTPWAETENERWQRISGSTHGHVICPKRSMALDKDDNIYFISGTTGSENKDRIYRLAADGNSLTLVKEFSARPDEDTDIAQGFAPFHLAIQQDGTTLYGMASGGRNFYVSDNGVPIYPGVIFRITPPASEEDAYVYQVIRDAKISDEGQLAPSHASASTSSTLIQWNNWLYYISPFGSAGPRGACDDRNGTLQRINLAASDINASYQRILCFNGTKDPKGASPHSITLGQDGTIYGVTLRGGENDRGTVFQLTPADDLANHVHTPLFQFPDSGNSQGDNGRHPRPAISTSDGSFYTATGSNTNARWWKILPGDQADRPYITVFYPQNPQPTRTTGNLQTRLHWKTENTDGCEASGGWSGDQPLQSDSAGVTVSLTEEVNEFTLTCTRGSDSKTITRTTRVLASEPAPAPVITNFRSDTYTPTGGTGFTLSWTTEDATTCAITRDDRILHTIAKDDTASGSHTVQANAAGIFEYGLTCTGLSGDSVTWTPPLSITIHNPVTSSSSGSALTLFALLPFGLLALLWSYRRRQTASSSQ